MTKYIIFLALIVFSSGAFAGNWRYDNRPIKMNGETAHLAFVKSENTIDFGFSYDGEQRASLVIRDMPGYDKTVFVLIPVVPEGKSFLCKHKRVPCFVPVRFDDEDVIRVRALRANGGGRNVLFLTPYKALLKRIANADTVLIEVQIYDFGTQVFEFDVSGFSMSRYQATE